MMITILAYKPDSEDYCRGCHMASYSSDFQRKSSENSEEIAEFLAGLMFLNSHFDKNESGYEFTWLFNGWDAEQGWDDDHIREEIEAEKLRKLIEPRAKELADAKESEWRVKMEKAARQAEASKTREIEAEERRRLKELKAKYEGAKA